MLRLFLDEGVPDGVARAFEEAGHSVVLLREAAPRGAPDERVCAIAEAEGAILVALDDDMRRLAQRRGVGRRRFRTLSLIKLSCREFRALERVRRAMSLIEHEWGVGATARDRRLFVEIWDTSIRTNR